MTHIILASDMAEDLMDRPANKLMFVVREKLVCLSVARDDD
jgi:hypothetical protein